MDALLIPTFLCPRAWESMPGNEKERHCSYCNKSVYNLAAMTARERLALLSSPAAKICSRYLAAIRRPAPRYKESYARHLTKYGVGVALAGSTLLILCEMHELGDRVTPSRYRAVAPTPTTCGGFVPMPKDWYTEIEVPLVGVAIATTTLSSITAACPPGEKPRDSVEIRLDPVQLETLLKSAPAPAAPDLPKPLPKKKKTGHRPVFGSRT